jgi:RNA polymerase sigma factor (sigma-70 family)
MMLRIRAGMGNLPWVVDDRTKRGMRPMDQQEDLARAFEGQRGHLRAVAYRMLGSLSEADDAVQGAWLHLERSGAQGVDNFAGWLTTVVARLCLDMLRSRKARREEPLADRLPEPMVSRDDASDPEREVMMADSISMALLVVLETLAPAERLAFVLHDMFAVPFEEIAGIVGKTPAAARQLASRGRRRVQGAPLVHDVEVDLPRQREVVNAFLAASRGGDLNALLAVLDPDVVLRAERDVPPLSQVRGARAVADQSLLWRRLLGSQQATLRQALVNGSPGIVNYVGGEPVSVLGFTIAGGKIVEIFVQANPARLKALDLKVLED